MFNNSQNFLRKRTLRKSQHTATGSGGCGLRSEVRVPVTRTILKI